jgi:hypothetical protein
MVLESIQFPRCKDCRSPAGQRRGAIENQPLLRVIVRKQRRSDTFGDADINDPRIAARVPLTWRAPRGLLCVQ